MAHDSAEQFSIDRGRNDRLAREAAQLYHEGKTDTVADAIRLAIQKYGVEGDPPSQGRVRKHIQALSMQAMGSAAYAQAIKNRLRAAEQFMSALDDHYAGVPMFLVGRAAKGHLDGDTVLHVRIYTDAPIEDLVDTLVELGYDEPTFETADTRFGKLNRLRFIDDDATLLLTRCLPAMLKDVPKDLHTGAPLATLTLKQLRDRLRA